MRTTLSQTWVTILDPLGMVEDLGRSLQVVLRGTKKEENFFSVSHVLETSRGGWNSDVAVHGIRVLKSDQ